MAEIVRAGILSVDEGQTEARHGARHDAGALTMRRIVLPQAMRVIIPPTGNETISMLKTTSLVSVIALSETAVRRPDHLRPDLPDHPAAVVASIWYLFLTSVLTVGQYFLERRYRAGRGRRHAAPRRARSSAPTVHADRRVTQPGPIGGP